MVFQREDDIAPRPDCKPAGAGNPTAARAAIPPVAIAVEPHPTFLGSLRVHSARGDVINGHTGWICPDSRRSAQASQFRPCRFPSSPARTPALSFPSMSSSVPVGALVAWMLLLTFK